MLSFWMKKRPMTSGALILLALSWGLFLGITYFGGLWLTLRDLPRLASRRGGCLFLSYILRLCFALAGMWLILRVDSVAFFFALAAFFLSRSLVTRALGRV